MRLINADALRETMYHESFETDTDMQKWDGGCWIRYKLFENALEDAPTIDAEPIRHGKWIYKEFEISKVGYYECSECGYVAFNEKSCHYCYNCGAKMDEDEISNIAKESADKISKALEKVRAKGMQKQNIKEDDEP